VRIHSYEFDMNHLIDSDPQDQNSDDQKVIDPELCPREDPKDLKLLEILIDKSIKRLEDFWNEIEAIRREELPKLYPEPNEPTNLEAQILKTIIGLKHQVKNGILPVKTITDAFNQERSEQSQSQDPEFGLTYHRIGRLLSTMGFRKAKTQGGTSAIIWDHKLLSQNAFSNSQNSCPQDG